MSFSATAPTVIPLQSLGVVDVGATYVGENEALAHALANTAGPGLDQGSGYAVKRGSAFVNEYPRVNSTGKRTDGGPDDPNHMLGAYPVLWPRAQGGLETDRPIHVPYGVHVRSLLQQSHKGFRKDNSFMFQAFGVLQKCQVCMSAVLQVKRKDFLRNQEAFHALKPKDLLLAGEEERRKVPYSNPTVKALRKQLTSMRQKIMGTDESRLKVRGQIKGVTAMVGPPSLWITINPADTADPIAQVIAGDKINLDNFEKTAGPNSDQRSQTISEDPYAAAKFFHFIINVVIEELFGLQKADSHNQTVKRKEGVFGKVAAYVGTVEAQGRGTLHLHIVLWLVGALTPAEMQAALKTEIFRSKVASYIEANIRADLHGANSAAIAKMPRETSVSYSRPPDPRKPNYAQVADALECKLAKAVQLHSCKVESCLVERGGKLVCKCRAPFDLSPRDYIDEDGQWGAKRSCAYLNGWNPAIMQCVRANQDIKLITNGADTQDITFYISLYVAKHQSKSSNTSALLAKKLAFHKKAERNNDDIKTLNKRLLQRCANTLAREQEFSAPEVVSYLMGWGDRFISHHFVTIYWTNVVWLVKKALARFRYLSQQFPVKCG